MNPMRRKRQQLDPERCVDILQRGRFCTLALAGTPGTDGYPYAVPVNYAYAPATEDEQARGIVGHLLIHCALKGTKLDALATDGRVSACVVDRDTVVPERFTTYFVSVIAYGRAQLVEDKNRRRAALVALADKYSPQESEDAVRAEIDGQIARTAIVDIAIEHLSGKQAIELV